MTCPDFPLISKRRFANQYEIKNLLGIHVKVMVIEDMLTWKFLVKWLDLY